MDALPPERERYIWRLFQQLRRRRFALGPEDYLALRSALRAGFGWASRAQLRELCVALWAKSLRERETLIALFEQTVPEELQLLETQPETIAETTPFDEDEERPERTGPITGPLPEITPTRGLPAISMHEVRLAERPFVFSQQFPLGFREMAQAWRQLRRPVRFGPPVELDVPASVRRRSAAGMVTPPVLVARRLNMVRLLLLVDRKGSMAPFHQFIDEVVAAIADAGRLRRVARYYFHDTPAQGADETLLNELPGAIFPVLDPILPRLAPLTSGYVYDDPELQIARPLAPVLQHDAAGAFVVIISDGGAARRQYDALRLLDTAGLLKALQTHALRTVWLNPLPQRYWAGTTAARIARHVPMLPLNQEGLYRAIGVLRGRPFPLERPL